MSIATETGTGWSGRLRAAAYIACLGALVLLAVAGPGYQAGFVPLMPALLMAATGFILFVIGFVLGGISTRFWSSRSRSWSALGVIMICIAALVTIATGYWVMRLRAAPAIHDISTDLRNPPAFAAIVRIRTSSGAVNSAAYSKTQAMGASVLDVAAAQAAAYPDLATLEVASPMPTAFRLAADAARAMHWDLVAVDPTAGRIEATDTTRYFGFKDDIVIRVAPSGQGSRIDVRSASRVGIGDVGTNARRIRAYMARLRSQIADADHSSH